MIRIIQDYILTLLGVLIFASCISLNGCKADAAQNNLEQDSQTKPKKLDTPIRLKVTKENNGKRCEAKLYDLGGGTEEDTPEYKRCLNLQKTLNHAAWDGNVEEIRKALENGANVNGGYSEEGDPLGMAITKKRPEAVQLLVENGANVNASYNFGSTPLKRAAYNNFPDIAKILIENGADICSNETDDIGQKQTPLEIAEKRQYNELISLIKSAGGKSCR